MKMEKPKTTNAKLWKGLTADEQKRWKILYKIFQHELNELSEIHNEVKAHNLAYEAVWKRE